MRKVIRALSFRPMLNAELINPSEDFLSFSLLRTSECLPTQWNMGTRTATSDGIRTDDPSVLELSAA